MGYWRERKDSLGVGRTLEGKVEQGRPILPQAERLQLKGRGCVREKRERKNLMCSEALLLPFLFLCFIVFFILQATLCPQGGESWI